MPPKSNRHRLSPSRISLADQIRKAIEASGRSDYELASNAGLAPSVVSRFVVGTRGLTLDSADRLCEVLGLHLVGQTGRAPRKVSEQVTPSKRGRASR